MSRSPNDPMPDPSRGRGRAVASYAAAGAVLAALVSAFLLLARALNALTPTGQGRSLTDVTATALSVMAAVLLGSFATGMALSAARPFLPLVAHVGSVTAVMVLILVVGQGGGNLWPVAIVAVGVIAGLPSLAGVMTGVAVRWAGGRIRGRRVSQE